MYIMKRYQIYLNPHSVGILDEVASVSEVTRSELIREAVDAVAARVGVLLSHLKAPDKDSYKWLRELTGTFEVEGKKQVNLSENIDEIYYR